jgi:hypothetical protein
MSLNFLAGAPIDSRVTFTRGSNATLVDSTGKITYAPNNLLLQSQTFENIAWASIPSAGTGLAPVVTADAGIAPDGTATADRVQFSLAGGTATGDVSRLRQAVTTVAAQYIFSFWVKSFDGISTYDMTADDANGAANPVAVTGEWQRFSVKATYAAGAIGVALGLRGARALANSNTADVLVWGAQLEPVTYQTTPGTYNATTTAAYYGPRFDYDPVTLAAKGLLIEEQRTNLATYSDQFDNAVWVKLGATVTANAAVSPDGTTNADQLATTATTTGFYKIGTGTSGTSYTLSIYIKYVSGNTNYTIGTDTNPSTGASVFNVSAGTIVSNGAGVASSSITPAGNGWYRCSVTYVSTGLSLSNILYSATGGAGTALIYGIQFENAAFATSYIPTVASQVTRSADVATMTGTNFSSWYNAAEGTFVVSADTVKPTTAAVTCVVTSADDGTSANRLMVRYLTANLEALNVVSSVIQTQLQKTYSSNSVDSAAFAYAASDFAFTTNGGAVLTDATGSVPVVNRLSIGNTVSVVQLNGHIRQIAYYNTRLPNATLQALTA